MHQYLCEAERKNELSDAHEQSEDESCEVCQQQEAFAVSLIPPALFFRSNHQTGKYQDVDQEQDAQANEQLTLPHRDEPQVPPREI